jgi:tetratricopeptide (TPR) repeat protein
MTVAAFPLGASSRLEDAVDQWVAKKSGRSLEDLRRELTLPESLVARCERLEQVLAGSLVLVQHQQETLLGLPEAERLAWVEQRSWQQEGGLLAESLLELAEQDTPEDRLGLARLAARVATRAVVAPEDNLFSARLDEVLSRSGLLEVRILRRRGQLTAARRRFAELDALLERDDAPLRFWLTLEADRCLTAAQLARDEGRFDAAATLLQRAARLLCVAGTEIEDFERLTAQVRTDLARGQAATALEHFGDAPDFTDPGRRLAVAALKVAAALRTGSPLLARRAFLGFGAERHSPAYAAFGDRLSLLEAAVLVLETQPSKALEILAPAADRLRAAGCLIGSLEAALVAARAQLAEDRPEAARAALAAGPLAAFRDLPATPAVLDACAQVTAHAAAGVPQEAFLDRLELWLILVVDSPGLELA